MAEIKFGKAGLKGDTPKPIKWIYRGFGLLNAIWVLVITAYPEIPVSVQLGVLKALGLITVVIYTVCQHFGWANDGENDTTAGNSAAVVLLVCAGMVFLTSCGTTRHSMKSVSVATDSTSRDTTEKVVVINDGYRSQVEKDSAIGISGTKAELHLTAEDLSAAFTTTGNKVTRFFSNDSGRQHARFRLNTDGSGDVDCETDSLTIVITGMTRDSVFQGRVRDSLCQVIQRDSHDAIKQTTDITVKQAPWWKNIINYLIAAVLGVLVWEILKKVIGIAKLV